MHRPGSLHALYPQDRYHTLHCLLYLWKHLYSGKYNVPDGPHEAAEKDVRQNKSTCHDNHDHLPCVDALCSILVEELWTCFVICYLASPVIFLVQSVVYPLCEGGDHEAACHVLEMSLMFVLKLGVSLFLVVFTETLSM